MRWSCLKLGKLLSGTRSRNTGFGDDRPVNRTRLEVLPEKGTGEANGRLEILPGQMEQPETVLSGEALSLDGLETNVTLGRSHLSVLKLNMLAILRSNRGDFSVGEFLTVDRPRLQHLQSHYGRC
jgi:hypothetical protein